MFYCNFNNINILYLLSLLLFSEYKTFDHNFIYFITYYYFVCIKIQLQSFFL